MQHEKVFERWTQQLKEEPMVRIECPHCGHENIVSDEDEEPTCELCDGHLTGITDEEE